MSRYKVTKHGTMYVDKYKPRFCPECASEMIKSDNKSEIDNVFLKLIKRTRTYSCLVCPECGCEMQKLKKTQRKPCRLFWKILLSVLFISIRVFTEWFTVYAVTHDGDLKTWVGLLGVFTLFVTLLMGSFDVAYVCDILVHRHIYMED
jgi:hypothetical protein